ncbi:TetR/AcrR family transcriptional regulator [Agromyces sp. NPDC049794]|uniref:TetR/AcrR family transcriptional regulator n=1 Tax=unclassified Agromyces TaxID=2639701 RepID=UPI0033C285DF
MPKVTAEYREARRDEIISAAMRCFMARGFQRTSMADIIADSGLSAGAIYGHFAGKKDLVTAVAGRVLEARRSDLQSRRHGGPPLAPAEVIATLIEGMRREPLSALLVQLWAEASVDDEIRDAVHGAYLTVRTTVEAAFAEWATAEPGRVDGDPDAWAARMAPIAMAFLPGFMVLRTVSPDFDQAAYIAALPELLPR